MKLRSSPTHRLTPAVRGALGNLLLAVALVAGAAAIAMLLPAAEPALVAQHLGAGTQMR
jgi:hypothetical protein